MGDRLVLSDFGLSALRSTSQTSKDLLSGGMDDYLSPEARHEDFTRGEIGRAHDVWALGCIFTEILTVMEGYTMQEFRNCRRTERVVGGCGETDHRYHQGGSVKEAIKKWLDKLKGASGTGHQAKTPEVLKFVTLIKSMLCGARRERPDIVFIVKGMAVISFRVKIAMLSAAFEKYTVVANLRASTTQVLIFVEAQRFRAIREAYEEFLGPYLDIFHQVACDVLEHMATLQTALDTQDFVDPRQSETVFQLLQHISDQLPQHLAQQVQRRWSTTVAAIDDPDILSCFRNMPVVPPRYREIGSTAVMKLMALAVSKAIRQGKEMKLLDDISLISLARENVVQNQFSDDLHELRTTASYTIEKGQSRNVLIEWRWYDLNCAEYLIDQQLNQMNAMAHFLSAKNLPGTGPLSRIVALDCRCFYHDSLNHRFGFVYDLSDEKQKQGRHLFPMSYSIHEYIHDTAPSNKERQPRPYLGAVFRMAQDLAETVHALHNAGWLHKNISSYNILMFCKPAQAPECFSFSVLSGFAGSRPEDSQYSARAFAAIHSLYDHPKYQELCQDNRANSPVIFKRVFDYYSLGVVLLELGLWRTAASLPSQRPGSESRTDGQPSRKTRKVVLPAMSYSRNLLKLMPELSARMGEAYMSAVKFCLEAADGANDDSEQCAKGFKKKVIDRLAECKA
jgi:serine/threonine protein kinase